MAWFHNNRPVHEDCRKVIRTESEEHMHHASLEVWDVREHDAGSYRVFAINSEGSAESTASLLVAHRGEQQGFTGKAGCMQESWQCLLQQRQEDRLRVVLRCTGSPFDKGQEAEQSPRDFSPAHGMVRTICFQRLPLVGPHRPGLAHGREHSGTVTDAEELLDEEIRWKLQRLREAKRAVMKKKQEALMSMPQASPPGKPSPPKAAATTDGSESLMVQVVKGYCKRGLLEPCPPLFVQEVKPQEAIEGHRCTFSCLFHGRPQPTVTWYNNAKPVGRIRGTAVHTTECCSTLTFPSVLPQHSGTITCVIFNPLGTVSSSAALYVRRQMQAYVEEKDVEEEEEVSLAFTAEQALPSEVPDSDLLSLPVEIKITAPTPTPEQDTETRETTRPSPNQTAPIIKHKFKFSFDVGNEPPQIVAEAPAHIHCHEGEAVVLECAVSGLPPPAVVWSLNGQCLSASERLRFEEGKNGIYRLHIQGVSVTDAGLYSCMAKNVAGTAQTDSELTVQPREARLYSKDGGTKKLPSTDHVLHLEGVCTFGNNEEEKITGSKEEEAQLPLSPRLSPSLSEQLEGECEKPPHFRENELEETVQDIMEIYGRQETNYTEESVRDTDDISEMIQHRGKAVSEEHSFGIDITDLHPSMSREEHELVAKDSGHFSEELEAEGDKVVPHTDTLSWDIFKSPFMEVKGQTHASEQPVLARECEDSQFFIPISPVEQVESDICMQESDVPAWEAMSPDVPLTEKPNMPQMQDNSASTTTKEQFDFYDFSASEQQEEQAKKQETSVGIEQDMEVDDNLCKEEMIDAGDTTHWDIHNYRQMLQGMESDAGNSSLGLILAPPGIETSGQDFTDEVEVHPEEVQFKEQLLPSETDETNITFDLKKFVEPFPAADTVGTEQAQPPTALESVEIGVTGFIPAVHEHDVLVEEMSLSEELSQSYRMQQEDVSSQEEAQPREIRRADLQIPNGDHGSIMISDKEGSSAEEINESELSVCGEDLLEGQIHSFLVESTADFQRGVEETHVWKTEELLETTDSQSDSFITDLKKAACEQKPKAGHQVEEEEGSGIQKIFETGMSISTCETESTNSPEEMLRDTQQESNTNKSFSFRQLLLGLIMDDPVAQEEQKKESWDKKSNPTEEASEHSLDREGPGPEPRAVQTLELEPDLSLAKYLRSTGMQKTPDFKGTVQKDQRENITSLEVEEVTFSTVYEYYNNQQELTRPFSPESEMSIELESASGEESPDSDRFYTPPSSVEIFETASSASYHTPLSTPERYSTPSEGSEYSTPPERYSTPSEGSEYSTPPERYSTPSEGSEYSTPPERYSTPSEEGSEYIMPPERYSTPSEEGSEYSMPPERYSTPPEEGLVYSIPPERYSTPFEGSKCNTPSEPYFTPFGGPCAAAGDSTPPERYWTPTGEYMDALAMLSLCERRQQPSDQPQAEVFGTPCEALEPSGRQMPPAFLKALSRKRLYEGSTLRFAAKVVGVPKPGVKWYHNKSLLELDERMRIEKDGDKCVLEITNVQKADGGQYMCHAVNIVGEAKSIVHVEVLSEDGRSLALPPPVTHQHVIHFDLEQNTSSRSPSPQEILLEVELDENEVKEFEKQVKIITSPEFSPDKKSMVVSLDVLPLALLEQAAGLAAENEDIKIDFQVTEMPPRFAVPFSDVKVTEGLEAVFECVVTGTPVPVVQWFRGDICVTPVTGKYVVIQKEGLHSLKVQKVGPSDSGWYHCRAMNRLGEATCKGSLIVVAQQGASANVSSETITGNEQHRSQKSDLFLCKTVSPGHQSATELQSEFELHIDDSEKAIQLLSVAQQEQEVEGEKCVSVSFDVFAETSQEELVEFKAEDSEGCSFEFQVTEAAPTFLKLISDYSTFLGASACFQCLVTGSPDPTVHWYKDGVLLEGDRYCVQEEEAGSHSLTIENLMQSDSGQYKCVATNTAGTAETYIASSLPVSSEEGRSEGYSSGLQLPDKEKTLEFEPEKTVYSSKAKMKMEAGQAPVFLKQVSNVEVWQGDVARLSVTVTGSPTPKVQWFFNSMKLASSTECKVVFAGNDHSLILPYAGVQDEGEYTCVASNEHGETTCSAHLHVRQRIPGVPCFTRKPDSMRCARGFTAVFEYTVAGEPCPDVLWFKGTEQLFPDARRSVAHHPDGSGSLIVQECMEEDTGLYTCKAVSALGEAICSAELLVLPEEHAVRRQSPALKHSAVAEDQSPLSYEEAGELPAAEGALRLEAMKEPLALLQLQMSQEEHMLPREDILPSLPPACLAAQSVEEMLTQAATTQESVKLLAEPLETLPAGPQGVVPAAAMETRLPGCLGTVAAQILLPKEEVIPETAEQMAALKTEASQALLQVSSTTESRAIDGDHMQVLEGLQAMQGKPKAEPRLASELAFTGGQAVPLETVSSLEAAEEDFAARIHEGQAVRFPLLLEEKQLLEEEHVVSLVKEGKSCDKTSKLESQQAETTMEAEIPLEQPLFAEVINTVTGHSQIKDVGSAAATADVASYHHCFLMSLYAITPSVH
ncbi:PREDICTED: titin-like [Nestor notabilis]|uniref:titin-like n=1 Tax=Nestor notabilis TaxID=176057 RepID=UPI0005233874|nr:PREDICTED: titin-like [Nestor notabilis]